MSILTILFILLVISRAAEAQRRLSNITLGSSLTPHSTWPSSSGVYAFGFFPQHVNSYAIGIFLPDKTVVWTANRDSVPTVPDDVVSLRLSTEGRLILRRRQGQDEDSFDHPTNTLLPGQRLPPGKEIFSSASDTDYGRGIFRLKMQTDGFLVQYPINTLDIHPSEDEAILEEWVYDCYATGKIGNLVGDEMVEERKVERMVKIGIWCVQYDPSLRPTMKKVLLMLEGTVEIPMPPSPNSFLSSI
ncbi:G-type lectin S-receptor-like serine/threonine-protein kinase LECRK3 [Salvia divinorum]|uniref:G-type lectin S-receptor-like serine/threonine-protein kinase LECRK3 n=1 Tax=Salvia divinorum TaxID=28513 RepID=A0ABD1GDA3_SALDI